MLWPYTAKQSPSHSLWSLKTQEYDCISGLHTVKHLKLFPMLHKLPKNKSISNFCNWGYLFVWLPLRRSWSDLKDRVISADPHYSHTSRNGCILLKMASHKRPKSSSKMNQISWRDCLRSIWRAFHRNNIAKSSQQRQTL